MVYRKPSIQLTQEFQGLTAAVAISNLTNCVVGPAYKVYSNDVLGSYAGLAATYAYASQMAGTFVDVNPFTADLLRDEQYPVVVKMTNVVLEVVAQQETGSSTIADLTLFNDATPNAFANVVAGNTVKVIKHDATVVAAQTDGQVDNGTPELLTTSTVDLFASVREGDIVLISTATDIVGGIYYVAQKLDNQNIVLDSAFYTGSGALVDVAFSVKRSTGENNAATYVVRTKISANSLRLTTELSEEESFITYSITKSGADFEVLAADLTITADDVTVALGVVSTGLVVSSATVKADYRALRVDLAANIRSFTTLSALEAVFGVGEIVAANPLAYALALCMQNAVTPTKGLGLSADLLTNEGLAYTRALAVCAKATDYVYLPLTNNPIVHAMFSAHVTQMSMPAKGKWRGAYCNRKLITTEAMIDSTLTTGSRVIVNTLVDGIVALGENTLSLLVPKFINVQKGDIVVITGSEAGEFVVSAKSIDNKELTLGDGFVATYPSSSIEFYVKRPDGLEANGITFYDSSAMFLTEGIAPGQHLVIEGAGSAAGDFIVTAVDSENKIRVVQVPGITSVQSALTYHIFRDLSRLEQAEFIKAYTESFRNRRLVHVWPDIVQINEGSLVRELPGYYLACAPVALTTGLPAHQGFTKLAVSGYSAILHSSDYFSDEELDIIADGGSMIFTQIVEGAPLVIRHELTTDRTAIKFQEWMITKNVDAISYFLVSRFEKFTGQYNVYDGLFSEMSMEATTAITYLREQTHVTRLGSMIKTGSLTQLVEGSTIDTVEAKFSFDIPAPLNNINITIVV